MTSHYDLKLVGLAKKNCDNFVNKHSADTG